MQSGKLYLQIKRRDKNYCLLCDENDTISIVKEKIKNIIQQFQQEEQDIPTLRLLHGKTQVILKDDETLIKSKITNNSILHLIYCIDDDDDIYEPVEITETNPQHVVATNTTATVAAAAAATSSSTAT